MITVSQIRAARGLLGWSQTDLATYTGLTQRSITNVETGKGRPTYDTLQAIEVAFENNGIEFIEGGVRSKRDHLTVIKGEGFADRFMDYLYETVKKFGLVEVLVNGINQELLTPQARRFVMDYTDKIKILGVKERLLVPETLDPCFMTTDPAQYRGLPGDYFADTTPIFIFGDYYAMMMFDIQEVWIINNPSLAIFQRKQYELLWRQGKVFKTMPV